MASSATHNPSRRPRTAGAGTGRTRIVLALFVGLALTSVCQGHGTGEHRLAPHLAILGETGAQVASAPHARPHTGTGPSPMNTIDAIGEPGATGAHDVVSLGVTLPLLALLRRPARLRWPRPGDTLPRANAHVQPEPPPPKQA